MKNPKYLGVWTEWKQADTGLFRVGPRAPRADGGHEHRRARIEHLPRRPAAPIGGDPPRAAVTRSRASCGRSDAWSDAMMIDVIMCDVSSSCSAHAKI